MKHFGVGSVQIRKQPRTFVTPTKLVLPSTSFVLLLPSDEKCTVFFAFQRSGCLTVPMIDHPTLPPPAILDLPGHPGHPRHPGLPVHVLFDPTLATASAAMDAGLTRLALRTARLPGAASWIKCCGTSWIVCWSMKEVVVVHRPGDSQASIEASLAVAPPPA